MIAEVQQLRALPFDLRTATALHFYEGKSHNEVARAVGVPRGTASSRIRRGLEQLKGLLMSCGYGAIVPQLEDFLEGAAEAPIPRPGPRPSVSQLEAAVAKLGLYAVAKALAVSAVIWTRAFWSSASS